MEYVYLGIYKCYMDFYLKAAGKIVRLYFGD